MQFSTIHGLVIAGFVRAKASDVSTVEVPTYTELVDVAGELVKYWGAVSKGALNLVATVYPPIVALPKSAGELAPMSRWDIGDVIINAAGAKAGLGAFDILFGLVNTPCGGGAAGNRVIAGWYQELGQRGWRWCEPDRHRAADA